MPEAAEHELSQERLRTLAAAQGAVTAGDVALYRQALARGWKTGSLLGFDAPYQARIREQLERLGLA